MNQVEEEIIYEVVRSFIQLAFSWLSKTNATPEEQKAMFEREWERFQQRNPDDLPEVG